MGSVIREDRTGAQSSSEPRKHGLTPGLWLLVVLLASVLLATCSSGGSEADGPARVEIISLDHAPIRPTAEEVSELAAEFGEDVVVSIYHFDTPEGDAFAEENELTDHTPIAIFVNGESQFDIDGRTVQFLSFPQGEGTGVVAEGDWTFDDLRTVLDGVVLDLRAG